MMFMMTKSLLLSVLAAAATTSSVLTEPITRIVGGQQADPGDFPYFVEMGGCGGALVAPDAVLFAAHCENWKNKQLSIGAYKTQSVQNDAQERFCEEWVADPKYGTGGSDINYDFALCKLNKPVIMRDSKVRLEINTKDSYPKTGENLVVMGLGDLAQGRDGPQFLHEVTVPVISNKSCNRNSVYGGQITENMLCAGNLAGGKDSCQGDSGGPIVQRTRQTDGTFVDTHVGVVSWGIGCAQRNKPGVYARTSKRATWIKDTVCKRFKSVASFCDNNAEPSPPGNCNNDLTIKLKTDNKAFETKWTLRDSKNKNVMTRQYLINSYENEHKLCLKANECYEWTIYDFNGMSAGSYSFEINGKQILSGNGKFRRSKKEKFCTGDGDNNPVSTPTKAPVEPPTKAPVESPTKAPAESPTRRPTTDAPSGLDDDYDYDYDYDYDTGFPTSSLTSSPTESPTDGPTAFPTENFCKDSKIYLFKNRPGKNCRWVGRGKMKAVRKKCRAKHKKIPTYDWCPETCGAKANLGSCV